MDNAKIHRAKKVRSALECEHKIEFIYLSPYSPILNPCELCFNFIKGHIKSNLRTNLNHHSLLENINQACNPVTKEIVDKFFAKCESF